VVQQRAGVHLTGGVGEAGDQYERHADAVAGLVVSGGSAEALLSHGAQPPGTNKATLAVSPQLQRDEGAGGSTPPAKSSDHPDLPPGRQWFIAHCLAALETVVRQQNEAQKIVNEVGVNYTTAYNNYTNKVDEHNKAKKLRDDLILDAILTFLPGGGIKGMINLGLGEAGGYFAKGVKDIFATNAEKFAKGVITGDLSEAAKFDFEPQKGPARPDQFTAGLANQVLTASNAVLKLLHAWTLEAAEATSKGDFSFDPDKLINDKYKIGDLPPKETANQIEKGMWQKHVLYQTSDEEEHYRVNPETGERDENVGPGGGIHEGGFKIGFSIRRRIIALAEEMGENGEEWIKDWGEVLHQQFELRNWGGEKERWHPDQWNMPGFS
jgi:hypothetical protein